MSGKLTVVVGGQYGSESKGRVAGYLGQTGGVTAVRVAGPNAGHTAYDARGHKWALRQIPVVAVTNPHANLVIGQGSEIDLDVLADEIKRLNDAGFGVQHRLFIDRTATLVTAEMKEAEGHYGGELTQRLGSTGKGVGAARAERAWRRAPVAESAEELEPWLCDTVGMLERCLQAGDHVLIEGTQGYGLGLHAGYYPFCTSSDCRAVDFLAMAGLSPWAPCVGELDVWVVVRTFPIRVAGNSGPLYGETTWDALAQFSHGYIRPEHTTVTLKERRVGVWDPELARAAVLANGGPTVHVALAMFDYLQPDMAGVTDVDRLDAEAWGRIKAYEADLGAKIELIGTGPDSNIDLRGR